MEVRTYLIAILALACTSATASEDIHNRSVAENLPGELASGPHHHVLDPILSDGYLDHFRIQTESGEFSAVGRVELRIRIKELAALEQLANLSRTKVFINAAADAGIDTVKSIAGAFTDPQVTLKALPKGVGRLFRRTKTTVERGIRQANEFRSGSSPNDAAAIAIRNAQISQAERSWAKKVGVDPYSTNLALRDAISSVALVDSAASFTVGLAIPGVASIGVDILSELADEVWSKAPSELATMNRERLRKAGLDDSDSNDVLELVWYSPTSMTILASSIGSLAGVSNLNTLNSAILSVKTYDEARFIVQTIAMLAWYHTSQQSLASFIGDQTLPHAIDTELLHVVLLPVDYLYATDQTLTAASRLKDNSRSESHSLWITGTMTPVALASLQHSGWTVRQNAMGTLFDVSM